MAADQLFNQIAKARHMFGGDTRMPVVLRSKCALGTGYGSQHSMDPAGLYANWPGWRIVAPSTPFDYVGTDEQRAVVRGSGADDRACRALRASGIAPVDDLDYYIPLGKAKVVRPGKEFTVLTYLYMTPVALDVAEKMGLDAEIIDLRSLDRAGARLGDHRRQYQEDQQCGGAGARHPDGLLRRQILTDEIQRRFFDYLDQPVKRIHGGESSPSVSKVLERAAYVGAEEIAAGFASVMQDKGERLWAAE